MTTLSPSFEQSDQITRCDDKYHLIWSLYLQKLPLLIRVVLQGDRFAASPRELQHAAVGRGHRARDGAGGEQIPGSHVAPGHAMMGQLLFHGPVHVLEIRPCDGRRLVGAFGLNGHLEVDVESVAVVVFQIREYFGFLKKMTTWFSRVRKISTCL